MSCRHTLSTGVLKKDPANVDAHIEVTNLTNCPIRVCVLAYDWDTNPPTALAVVPGSPFVIPANSNQYFNVDLTGVFDHYEIRLSVPSGDVIANVFALNANGTLIASNRVLFKDLVQVSDCLANCCLRREPWPWQEEDD